MIHFKSCNKEYIPGIYLHGTILDKYNTDVVKLVEDIYPKISVYYLEGKRLPILNIDIPEGTHLCMVDNTLCILFTWKRILFTKGGYVYSNEYQGSFDVWLKQMGLIVDVKDKEGIMDAQNKFKNKEFII